MSYTDSWITKDWLPSTEAIKNVNPDAATLLPDSYKGANPSVYLATAYANRLTETKSLDAMFDVPEVIPPYGMEDGQAGIYNSLNLILNPNANPVIYFDFLSLFQVDTLTDEQVSYALYLTNHFGDATNQGIIGMIEAVYQNQFGFLERGSLVTVEQIEKYNAMSKWLRNEGLTAPIATIWMISQAWTSAELIETMSEGIEMSKLSELLSIGFRDPQEVIEYVKGDNKIPDSWMQFWLDI